MKPVEQVERQVACQLQFDERVCFGKRREHTRKMRCCKILGHANPDAACHVRLEQLRDDRIVEPKQLSRRAKQPLAGGSQLERAGRALEYGATKLVFEALHLETDGRLCPAEPIARAREALCLRDGHEAAQQVQIKGARGAHGSVNHFKC